MGAAEHTAFICMRSQTPMIGWSNWQEKEKVCHLSLPKPQANFSLLSSILLVLFCFNELQFTVYKAFMKPIYVTLNHFKTCTFFMGFMSVKIIMNNGWLGNYQTNLATLTAIILY